MAQNWLASCNVWTIVAVVIVIVLILIVMFVWLCSAFGAGASNGVLAAVKNNQVPARPIPRAAFGGQNAVNAATSAVPLSPAGHVLKEEQNAAKNKNHTGDHHRRKKHRCNTDVEPLRSRSSLTFTSPSSVSHRSSR